MKKYGLLLKTLQIVGVLLWIKIGICLAGLSILPMNALDRYERDDLPPLNSCSQATAELP
ncbi:MAG: hypothetical protein MUC66_04315 [Methanolinea sp.]|nr:hypothetical protein [Methanolinea sp.]